MTPSLFVVRTQSSIKLKTQVAKKCYTIDPVFVDTFLCKTRKVENPKYHRTPHTLHQSFSSFPMCVLSREFYRGFSRARACVSLHQVLELLGVPDESVSLLSGEKVMKMAFQLLWNSPAACLVNEIYSIFSIDFVILLLIFFLSLIDVEARFIYAHLYVGSLVGLVNTTLKLVLAMSIYIGPWTSKPEWVA